jgi:xanthine dehydrogenase YagS FAD-binding subunit
MAIVHDVIPPFQLFQPSSIDDALELLDARGEEAWVLAGGMDSFDWLKDRTKRTSAVVELRQIAELNGIREANGGTVRAGTSATQTRRQPSTASTRSSERTAASRSAPRTRHRR